MKNKIDCTEIEDMIEYYKNKNEHKKHLKGYMYDSLVYRYQLALYKASLKDAEDIMIRKTFQRQKPHSDAMHNYNRDLMRFCVILDEAIGEHD